MKKMMILAVMMVMTISANAMSYNAAKLATHHHAPAVHHPAPAPHHGKHGVAHNDHHGTDRHIAMNNRGGKHGHFSHR